MKKFRKRNLVENTEKKVVSLKILIKITFLVKIFWSQFCFVRSYKFFFFIKTQQFLQKQLFICLINLVCKI